jgi:hypothetical protein
MMLSKSNRQALEWSEEDDDELARRPTILGGLSGLNGPRESAPVGAIGRAPRIPSLGSLSSFAAALVSVLPPPIAEARISCRPTRRAPAFGAELAAARASVRPTGRPSQFPF